MLKRIARRIRSADYLRVPHTGIHFSDGKNRRVRFRTGPPTTVRSCRSKLRKRSMRDYLLELSFFFSIIGNQPGPSVIFERYIANLYWTQVSLDGIAVDGTRWRGRREALDRQWYWQRRRAKRYRISFHEMMTTLARNECSNRKLLCASK